MDNMRKLNMDTEELYSKIEKLDGINSTLFKKFDEIKALMDTIKGEWISQTSEVVLSNFEKEIKNFQRVKAQRSKDFNFLKNTYENYVKMEKSIDSLIDDKVATSDANFFTAADKKATVDYTSKLNNEVIKVNNPNTTEDNK